MNQNEESKIVEKLNLLIKLVALIVLKDMEFKEQVRILSGLGLQPKEIAEILGKTSANVRVTLSNLRKERNKIKKPNKKPKKG